MSESMELNLSTVLPYLNDIIVCLNLNKIVVEFNAAAEQYFDCKSKDILGKDFIKFCKAHNIDFPFDAELIIKNGFHEFTHSIQHTQNEYHTITWKLTPLYSSNKNKKLLGYILVGTDKTQPKFVGYIDKNTQGYLEAVIESIAGNHWWKDLNGRYIGCNEAMASSVGLNSKKDVIGKTDYDMPWANQADELIKHDNEVIKSRISLSFEENITTKDGKTLTFSIKKVPLKDEKGSVIGTIGTSVDITPLKNALIEINRAKEKADIISQSTLESIINSIAGNHWWKDLNGRYRGCNTQILKTMGLTSADIIGKTDYEILEPAQAELLVQNDLEVIKTGKPHQHEEQINTKDGKTLTFLVTKVPFRDHEGNIIGTIGNSFDITPQKNALIQVQIAKEKAENANRAKSDFIANMSHDLRTPLSGILGVAELLKGRIGGEEGELVRSIVQSSNILLNLFNEIIEYIKIESGNFPSRAIQFDIGSLLVNVSELVAPCIKEKGLKLDIIIDNDIPACLIGDKERIHRILLNLLSNAIKFSEAGNITIILQIAERSDKNIVLRIAIKDNGIGIPENQLDQIFTRFTRLNSAYDGVFKGVGLGLSIVKQFASDLKGEITVESQSGKGSIFTCIVPFKIGCLDEINLINQNTTHSAKNGSQISEIGNVHYDNSSEKTSPLINCNQSFYILLVEDDPLAQKIAKYIFEELGCQVEIATTGNLAVEKAKEHKYSLVLMDIGLPDISGYEAAKKIKASDKNVGKFTPIIALTAHADVQNKQQCFMSGMEDVLAKPIRPITARSLIEKYYHNLSHE
jgi:two-component system, OmpR family, aerobic respiration control sensor histidine kinase ArcB